MKNLKTVHHQSPSPPSEEFLQSKNLKRYIIREGSKFNAVKSLDHDTRNSNTK